MRETFETIIEHPIATFFLWLMLVGTVSVFASIIRGDSPRRERRVVSRPSMFKVTTRTETALSPGMRVYLNAELDEEMRVSRVGLHTCPASELTRMSKERTWVEIISAEGKDFEVAEAQLRLVYPLIAATVAKHFPFPSVMTADRPKTADAAS